MCLVLSQISDVAEKLEQAESQIGGGSKLGRYMPFSFTREHIITQS